MQDNYLSLPALVKLIASGSTLAIPKDESGVALAATRALLRLGIKDLHLLCVPTSGIQADLLIGAGRVATLESGAVTFGELGAAPRFVAAVKQGLLNLKDSTCPAIYAALQASEKGIPFMPLRGVIGSDLIEHRSDWKLLDNPFTDHEDPLVLLPAIQPDVALFHARLGDAFGNVWVGNRRECILLAHAAKTSLVTVEERVSYNLMEDDRLLAGVIPPLYIKGLAHVPNGAWPLGMNGYYESDLLHLKEYAAAAMSDEGFAAYFEQYIMNETLENY